jgi:precorrin-6A/cobalt-precorrin-6A reductase
VPDPAIPIRTLILGGTSEARALAQRLVADGVTVTSSLAGRVADPALPAGAVRIGGFGGPDGLADYLRRERIAVVVDATHPFAATISASAALACTAAGVPLLRLARPGWATHPLATSWRWVDSYPDAVRVAGELGSRVFLTTGRTTLSHFVALRASYVLVRLVDPIDRPLPTGWRVIRSRGPYTVEGEHELMAEHGIDVLVTKDSGGELTAPKLTAAAELGVPVVVVRRPADPVGASQVSTVEEAVGWVHQVRAVRAGGPVDRP